MESRLKLSAVLACYNGEKYIEKQLNSILDQSRKIDEVIVTDDRSSDRTVELVNRCLAACPPKNWKCEINETNLGFAENFRKALEQATGDLIFLCDQDDIWKQDRAEQMAAIMECHPEIGLLNTDYASFRDGENLLMGDYCECAEKPVQIRLNRHTFFLRYPGCVMCVRKSFYDKVKDLWIKGWAHDEFLWSAALLYDCCYALHYCSLERRLHEEQTSGGVGHTKEKRIAYLSGLQKSSDCLEKAAWDSKKRRLYRKMRVVHQYRLELIRDKKWIRAMQLLFCLGYYHSVRSYPIELMIALKGEL